MSEYWGYSEMRFGSNKKRNISKTSFQSLLLKSLTAFACLLMVANVGFAQKSSGVLEQDDTLTNSYADRVVNVEDDVTKNAYAVESEVRFLLRPKREAKISANMSGKVSRMHFNVGQRFRRGQTLISLNCAEIEARYLSLIHI